jgi:hypothetical protein
MLVRHPSTWLVPSRVLFAALRCSTVPREFPDTENHRDQQFRTRTDRVGERFKCYLVASMHLAIHMMHCIIEEWQWMKPTATPGDSNTR